MRERERKITIKLPPLRPATAEQLARRRRVLDEAAALREEIGPIAVSVSELLREIREQNGGR
jgi:hypothetical protein